MLRLLHLASLVTLLVADTGAAIYAYFADNHHDLCPYYAAIAIAAALHLACVAASRPSPEV